MSNTTQN